MQVAFDVSLRGYNDLRDMKGELALIPSAEPEAVVAWAKDHPASAWAKHLAEYGERVVIEYVRRLIQIVVIIDQSPPKRIEVQVKPSMPAAPPLRQVTHRVAPVAKQEHDCRLERFFEIFSPLQSAYVDMPELRNLFAEADRVRKVFDIA